MGRVLELSSGARSGCASHAAGQSHAMRGCGRAFAVAAASSTYSCNTFSLQLYTCTFVVPRQLGLVHVAQDCVFSREG